jgi:hypothetical protein
MIDYQLFKRNNEFLYFFLKKGTVKVVKVRIVRVVKSNSPYFTPYFLRPKHPENHCLQG